MRAVLILIVVTEAASTLNRLHNTLERLKFQRLEQTSREHQMERMGRSKRRLWHFWPRAELAQSGLHRWHTLAQEAQRQFHLPQCMTLVERHQA